MDPDSKRLRVSVSDGTGRAVRDGGLARWLAAVAPPRTAGDVNVALVSDVRMLALNRKYRRKNAPTDVLSFRADLVPSASRLGDGGAARRARPSTSLRTTLSLSKGRAAGAAAVSAVGEIAIATGVARRQAKDAGHSYQTELRVLALHGLLHLLGYDHHDRRDNGRMGRVEAALRRKGGLATGLIERASAPRGSAKSRRVGA